MNVYGTSILSASLCAALAAAHIYWYQWQFWVWLLGTLFAANLADWVTENYRITKSLDK